MIDSTVLTRFNSLQKYWFPVGVCDALCGLRHIFRCITKTNGSQTHLKRCGAISFKKNRPSITNKPLASLAVWKIQTGKLSRWDGESIVVHSIAFGYIRRHTHTRSTYAMRAWRKFYKYKSVEMPWVCYICCSAVVWNASAILLCGDEFSIVKRLWLVNVNDSNNSNDSSTIKQNRYPEI